MGVNRWSDREEHKRNETDDAASRLGAPEEPAENPEKREVFRPRERTNG